MGLTSLFIGGAAFFMGCSRELPIPLNAVPRTPTSTATGTAVPTNTPTPTATLLYTATSTNSPTATLTASPTATPDPLYNLDDMEDNDVNINATAGRSGSWFIYSDYAKTITLSGTLTLNTSVVSSTNRPITVVTGQTAASNPITLQTGGDPLTAGTVNAGTLVAWGESTGATGNGSSAYPPGAFLMSAPGYNSGYSVNVVGKIGPPCTGNDLNGSYQTCPYVGWGFNFVEPKAAFNLSAFTGFRFYGKCTSSAGYATGVRLKAADTTTDASSDSNGHAFVLTSAWAPYTCTFQNNAGGLQTEGWGVPQTHAYDSANAMSLQWQVNTGSMNYDVWIDNITLIP